MVQPWLSVVLPLLVACCWFKDCVALSVSNKPSDLPMLTENLDQGQNGGRRDFLRKSTQILSSAGILSSPLAPACAEGEGELLPSATESDGVVMYKTQSGLKYIELKNSPIEGAKTPRYGQFCIIDYVGYVKLPNAEEKTKFEANKDYIVKHGNARLIPGLDEGIHTMKEGSSRRIIIPPKLGYIRTGLGPLPAMPWSRATLSKLIDEMVEQRGGNIVFDVTLKSVFDDEADIGYYDDESLSDEEIDEIQRKLASFANRGTNIVGN